MVELLIEGNLTGACHGWYETEQLYRRRRVAFTSYRANDTVTAIVLEAPPANHSPYISCLASLDRRKHFFVGTDALNALEVMLGVSLCDDQKKALRNKFERHGSVTIRKDHDADGLFSLIENNNDIKPRNLHKGVRVYPWEKLPAFLKDLASKVSTDSLPESLPCNNPSSLSAAQMDHGQAGYVTSPAAMQFDAYGNPVTPTAQQIPYFQSSPGAYSTDPYAINTYATDPAYVTPAGFGSPTFAPQYTMPSPPMMMNGVTAQAPYGIAYAPQTVHMAHWEHPGLRYSQ